MIRLQITWKIKDVQQTEALGYDPDAMGIDRIKSDFAIFRDAAAEKIN